MDVRGLLVLLSLAAAADAAAAGFGGISRDGRQYLAGKTEVCTPLPILDGAAVSAGRPQCLRKKAVEVTRLGFTKPRPARKVGEAKLVTTATGTTLSVAAGSQPLLKWDAGAEVRSIDAVYISVDGAMVVVEYTVAGLRGKTREVAGFDVGAPSQPAVVGTKPTSRPSSQPTPPTSQPASQPGLPALAQRLLASGGVWEQAIVPCDLPFVRITLRADGSFTIEVETRCQGKKSKSKFGGRWGVDGPASLLLSLPNDDGTVEGMGCRVVSCPGLDGEECLACGEDDFVVREVRR